MCIPAGRWPLAAGRRVILVAGSLNVDFIVRVPHLAAPGETVIGADYTVSPGGKGANQAVACARAGGPVAMLGALGRDPYTELLRDSLRASGADLTHLLTLDGPTGAAFIGVSEGGENSILVASGANARLRSEHLPDLAGISHLVMPLETPLDTVRAYAQAARKAGVQVVLNAAPAQPLDRDLLGNVTLLIVNEGELRAVSDAAGLGGGVAERAAGLRRLGPEVVVVTLGAQGCLAIGPDEEQRLPAHPVTVVDTTGAGDTFCGVLVAYLERGAGLRAALQAATVGAALACTRAGAQPSMPSRAEIEAELGRA